MSNDISDILKSKLKQYNNPDFISQDPVSIPHRFSKKQDIEIAGLFAAVFSWGNRKTIINKSTELMMLMNNSPYEFIRHHAEKDLKTLLKFKHRTFNATDLLYFISFLKKYYSNHQSLENAFSDGINQRDENVMNGLIHFHDLFFDDELAPPRTRKHIPTPLRNSSCKRLNMFLRWMVRNDKSGVDFGIWKNISPAQLIIPLDVHVQRIAIKLGLMKREIADWKAAVELTTALKKFDKTDPVKFDFALFGMGVNEKA